MRLLNRLKKLEEFKSDKLEISHIVIWKKDTVSYNGIKYILDEFNDKYPQFRDDKPIKHGMTRLKLF